MIYAGEYSRLQHVVSQYAVQGPLARSQYTSHVKREWLPGCPSKSCVRGLRICPIRR